jgi:MYXO-CTERM domain-containing protein
MRHIALLAAAVIAGPLLHAAPAHACFPDYQAPEARLYPTSEASQSARLHVESRMTSGRLRYTLHDAAGERVIAQEVESIYLSDPSFEGGNLTILEPAAPLAPGTYTYRLSEDDRELVSQIDDPNASVPLEHTFTITDGLPPEGAPASPEITWRVVTHDGPQDPELGQEPAFPCGPNTGGYLMTVDYDVTVPDTTTPGYITIALEGYDSPYANTLTSTIASPPRATVTTNHSEADFVQCVTATFTDIYGRSSQPTRSCQPDQCVARHRNDRGPVDWADVPGCEDWSPGFAQRNAPAGCACAQAPGAPSGSPALLGLGLLGLFGLRRRR